MKKLFDSAEKYLAESDWKDLALLKFCLFSMGILTGTHITCKNKKTANIIASIVFIVTYIPQMMKFIPILLDKNAD